MRLTGKQKRIARWVGYPLLALFTFILAFSYTFPYQRLKGKIIEVLSEKYDVSIASIEPTLIPGGMVLETIMLKTRPERAGEKPVVIVLQEVEVDIGLIAAVFGTVDLDVMAKVAGGKIEGNVTYSSSGLESSLETEMLPLANIPGVAEAVGLPMSGALNAEFDLALPGMKWEDAEGSIKLNCVGCTVGDGKAKLTMQPKGRRRSRRAAIFASEGLTVPRLNLGAAVAEVDIEDGVGTIESFTASSKDGFLKITGEIRFSDPFSRSTFPGCMAFKLSDELKKREGTFGGIEAMLPPKARQDDGSFAIPTKGKLTALRWDVRRQCKDLPTTDGASDDVKRSRPSIPSPRSDDPASDEEPSDDEERRVEVDEPVIDEPSEADAPEPELRGPGSSGPPLSVQKDDVGRRGEDDGEGADGDEREDDVAADEAQEDAERDREERDGDAPEDLGEDEEGFEDEGSEEDLEDDPDRDREGVMSEDGMMQVE